MRLIQSPCLLRVAMAPHLNAGLVENLLAVLGAGAAFRQSERINPIDWIGRVLIPVQSTCQPDRVLRQESAAVAILVPMPVVVQPRLVVEVLPLEADRVTDTRLARRLADDFLCFASRPEGRELQNSRCTGTADHHHDMNKGPHLRTLFSTNACRLSLGAPRFQRRTHMSLHARSYTSLDLRSQTALH